jgi:hypothetical protein
MLNPKFISDSVGKKSWFECPLCFEIYEYYKNSVRGFGGTHSSCGCRRSGDTYKPSSEETRLVRWLKKQIKNETTYLPPILQKLKQKRRIAYEWNTDVNTEASNNFINSIGPRPANATVGWKDQLGPISPENFEWKMNADKSGTDRTTDSD